MRGGKPGFGREVSAVVVPWRTMVDECPSCYAFSEVESREAELVNFLAM